MDLSLAAPDPLLFALLVLLGGTAGFISSIAGAGGVLVLPMLLTLGLPPGLALGTNKLQSVFGTASSAWNFFRKGQIRLPGMGPAIACALLGAALGTSAVQRVDQQQLATLLPLLLIGVALYLLFSPRVGDIDQQPRLGERSFALSAALGIGFYGGFFGPGMGSLFAAAFVGLRGFNLVRATAHTKVLVLATNVCSLALFVATGQVAWLVGLAMALGQVLGARLGSNLVISRGTRLVKPLIILATLALAGRLLWQSLASG
ncbi:TSUP family transporter [Motiliproteus sp. SC1-56]|uniref:TSUP family transporter n=1 Tax=Motiliproteus sp. SC1-56 TaxID=2799565 RepID=UPI001A8E4A26|nr:TSUP family transporter [Motiliproteus sp. SC1-56]